MDLKDIRHLDAVQLQKGDALLVVDMQNDFMPGGALAVDGGDAFLDRVNVLMSIFKEHDLPVVFPQDWHPPDHDSFASRNPGKSPFDPYEAPGIGPVLWPDHVVQGTRGAEFHPGLDAYLRNRGVKRFFICGLAANYCVYFTAADGTTKGYEVIYLSDLTNPVGSPPDSMETAINDMQRKGVRFLRSADIRRQEAPG